MKKKVNFTAQQNEAKKQIEKWFNADKKQMFVLAGYAGTGKSFLIQRVIKFLKLKEDEVAFIAPTGKAAEVLNSRGVKNATTVHKLIYIVSEEEEKIDGKLVKKISFIKKTLLEKSYKLIILDEFSMVSEKILDDLRSFGIKILVSGDSFQLPPIEGLNESFVNPDFTLTETIRQSLENPILKLATDIRQGKDIYREKYDKKKILFLKRSELTPIQEKSLFLSCDQIIVGKNSTKMEINNLVRKSKGIDISVEKMPLKGEKVISLSNNWNLFLDKEYSTNLVNGTIGILKENSQERNQRENFGTLSIIPNSSSKPNLSPILFDSGIFKNGAFSFDLHKKAFLLPDGRYELASMEARRPNESKEDFRNRMKNFVKYKRMAIDEEEINRFEFAYAITGHKSQGSEWEKIIIVDESNIFGRDQRKWLYTCVTRAKDRLIILK